VLGNELARACIGPKHIFTDMISRRSENKGSNDG
jgi:hypothetical protein